MGTHLTEELIRELPVDSSTWLMVLNRTRNRKLVVEPMEWEVNVRSENGKSSGRCRIMCTLPWAPSR